MDLKNISKRVISFILTIALSITATNMIPSQEATASSKYITVEDFAKAIAIELGISSLDVQGSDKSGYVNALIDKGVILKEDFTSYKAALKRGDAMVLLNRVDEYLFGETLDADLVQTAIDKRISDITKVKKSKREDVVKAYLKGYIKGYSNGEYSTDRNLKVTSKIAKTAALSCLKMLKDKSLRAKISPDGQLIRTTNLPKYAKYYPYILASFPNSYYDWMFSFEGVKAYDKYGQLYELQNMKDYAAPVNVSKTTYYDNFKTLMDENLNQWVEKVRKYVEYTFNVDYRTIDEKWIEGVMSTHFYKDCFVYEDHLKEDLKSYISNVKKYKTIIECNTIAIDGSSLYFYDEKYYLRTYVKYRIVSTDIKSEMDTNTLTRYKWHNKLLFSGDWVDIRGFVEGQWREGHFDISLSDMLNGDGTSIGVATALYMDGYYMYRKVD